MLPGEAIDVLVVRAGCFYVVSEGEDHGGEVILTTKNGPSQDLYLHAKRRGTHFRTIDQCGQS